MNSPCMSSPYHSARNHHALSHVCSPASTPVASRVHSTPASLANCDADGACIDLVSTTGVSPLGHADSPTAETTADLRLPSKVVECSTSVDIRQEQSAEQQLPQSMHGSRVAAILRTPAADTSALLSHTAILSHTLALEPPTEDSNRRVRTPTGRAQHMHELNTCDLSNNVGSALTLAQTASMTQSTITREESHHTGRTRHLFAATVVPRNIPGEAAARKGAPACIAQQEQTSGSEVEDTGELPVSRSPKVTDSGGMADCTSADTHRQMHEVRVDIFWPRYDCSEAGRMSSACCPGRQTSSIFCKLFYYHWQFRLSCSHCWAASQPSLGLRQHLLSSTRMHHTHPACVWSYSHAGLGGSLGQECPAISCSCLKHAIQTNLSRW